MSKDAEKDKKPRVRKPIRPDGMVKVTLLIPSEVDYHLSVVAARSRTDRSFVASKLLKAGLGRFKLDEEAGQTETAA